MMAVRAASLTVLLPCLAACHSGSGGVDAGPAATIPPPNTFDWTANGQTITAAGSMSGGAAYGAGYLLGAAPDGSAFSFTVEGLTAAGERCTLAGAFTALVPPLPGTYAVVPMSQAGANGKFTATCASGPASSGALPATATAGEVVLVVSDVGDVEGTFELSGLQVAGGAAPPSITGGFNVDCGSGAGQGCGPYTPGTGTCADLAACCGASAACMQLYTAAMRNGDTACARLLLANGRMYCP
jgi:hypothetical protein